MTYYDHVRTEIRALLPNSPSSILDIGAGAGATLRWLKEMFPNAKTTGVEINSNLHDQLRKNADVAIIGDVDACFPNFRVMILSFVWTCSNILLTRPVR